MPISSIEDVLEDLKQGKMIILVDDEDRENEGDLTIAAEKVTPEAINFMARYGRGLICLALSPDIVEQLRSASDGLRQSFTLQDRLHSLRGGQNGRDDRDFGRRPGPHDSDGCRR